MYALSTSQGKCKFGDTCSFSHKPQGRVPVCSFFEKEGSCRYGDGCKFLHGKPSAASTRPAAAAGAAETAAPASAGLVDGETAGVGEVSFGFPSAAAAGGVAAAEGGGVGPAEPQLDAGDNCGICLENIPASGKRFGLLNCDHVYCLGESRLCREYTYTGTFYDRFFMRGGHVS